MRAYPPRLSLRLLFPPLLALAACNATGIDSSPAAKASVPPSTATNADFAVLPLPQIDTVGIKSDIALLSSDAFEGRAPGTHGDELARTYIQQQFAKSGLAPGAADGTWMQAVSMLGITSTVERTLSVHGALGTLQFAAPDDFTAVAGSPSESSAWDEAPLLFVGYGIAAPEQRWDDFKGLDVKGKVLLVLNNDPSDEPDLFAGKTRLYYGRWTYKYEEAARRGAAGVIILHTAPSAGYPYHVVQANHGRENFWLPFKQDQPTLPIRSWCTEDAARKICRAGGKDLDELVKAAQQRSFLPIPIGINVSLAIRNSVRQLQSANVLGKLPGSDPNLASETVIITAHFDHLGRGKPRGADSIYNGALDNASGVAGMLAVLRACSALPERPRRSILFASVTAEESGLLGSEWLATHLPCERRDAIANFNIDGLNIWGMTHDIEFVGYGKNSLTTLASEFAKAQGRRIEPDTQPDLGIFYRSDHFNFARQGIPAAYFKAGSDFLDRPADRKRMKASYTATHYHQPTDELADWWNFDGAVADLQLLARCMLATASLDAPTWTKGDEFEKLR